MNNLIISIDGPAGSGKERIAQYISKKYKLFHLDSGILYRQLALLIITKKIDLNNLASLKKFVKSFKNLSLKSHTNLRKENISKVSSRIATFPFIRNFINKQQKIIVKKMLKSYKGCVVDGRDIGSKVFKDAKIKLFIEVDVKIRAKRRHKQLIALGEKSIYSQILKEIQLRDKIDKNRKHSPLVIPKGAKIINNSADFKSTTIALNKAIKE